MACEKLKCGHSKCCEEDDHCGMPEHRFCAFCQAEENGNDWERTHNKLEERFKKCAELLGKVMDRLKEPEAGLAEDLEQILRDEIQAVLSERYD